MRVIKIVGFSFILLSSLISVAKQKKVDYSPRLRECETILYKKFPELLPGFNCHKFCIIKPAEDDRVSTDDVCFITSKDKAKSHESTVRLIRQNLEDIDNQAIQEKALEEKMTLLKFVDFVKTFEKKACENSLSKSKDEDNYHNHEVVKAFLSCDDDSNKVEGAQDEKP